MQFEEYKRELASLTFGKQLPTAIYCLALYEELPSPLRIMLEHLRERLEIGEEYNILKLHTRQMKVSFLSYPDFERGAHPALKCSIVVDLVTGKSRRIDYSKNINPPILHRKERFIPEGHAWWKKFDKLTRKEEELGLLEHTRKIGFLDNWNRVLREKGVSISGHQVKEIEVSVVGPVPKLKLKARGKTALLRKDFSKPIKILIESQLLRKGMTVFDYGCGHGADAEGLTKMGYKVGAWDPNHRVDGHKEVSDIVNLGFVLNVIEDPVERVETLEEAWSLTEHLLVVSVLISGDENYSDVSCCADGVLTKRGTFQKYFEPTEIRAFLEDVTDADVCSAAHGVYFIFRKKCDEQDYLSSRSKRYIDWESLSRKLGLLRALKLKRDPYEENPDLLDSFWQSVLSLGRFPRDDEFESVTDVKKLCGSLPKALQLFIDKFGEATFEAARKQRRDDVLVFMAAAVLGKKVPFSQLSVTLQRDIRGLCGSYGRAEELARELMFASGDEDELELAVHEWGKGVFDAKEGHLTLHKSLIPDLPSILRVFLTCASRLWCVDDADMVKLHVYSGKVTCLYYDDFDGAQLPELEKRVKIDLKRLFVTVFDHRIGERHQLLFFKERFMRGDDPGLSKAKRFSSRLNKLGLEAGSIGLGPTKEEFFAALDKCGLTKGLNKKSVK